MQGNLETSGGSLGHRADLASKYDSFWSITTSFFLSLFVLIEALSLLRHDALITSAWDLGIFHQATWLISEGHIPFSTFLGQHILADHASMWLYLIALPFKLFPYAQTLLTIQALAVALAIFPLALISRNQGLSTRQTAATLFAYCLFPPVINISLFDFHPETIAIPFFFLLFLAQLRRKFLLFIASAVAIALTKEVLALSVAAYGLSCILLGRQRLFGLIALCIGTGWFAFATMHLIPSLAIGDFTTNRFISRFKGLGNSYSEIALNSITKPWIFVARLASQRNLNFLFCFLAPIAYVFKPCSKNIYFYLIASSPVLATILLTTSNAETSLSRQYCLALIPYASMLVVDWLSWANSGKTISPKAARVVIIFALFGFAAFSRVDETIRLVARTPPTHREAIQSALEMVPPDASIITTDKIAAQTSDRKLVQMLDESDKTDPSIYQYILIDNLNPGWKNSKSGNAKIEAKAVTSGCAIAAKRSLVTLYHCPKTKS